MYSLTNSKPNGLFSLIIVAGGGVIALASAAVNVFDVIFDLPVNNRYK